MEFHLPPAQAIPDQLKAAVDRRIRAVAEEHFSGRFTSLDIHFRGKFCYIDAYQEPVVSDAWPPEDWPETREEYIDRLRSTPVHLCRLQYHGSAGWSFAFFTYSDEKYTRSVFPDGEFLGQPEDAFMVSAEVYL